MRGEQLVDSVRVRDRDAVRCVADFHEAASRDRRREAPRQGDPIGRRHDRYHRHGGK